MNFAIYHKKENGEPVLVNMDRVDYITQSPKLHQDHAILMMGDYPLVLQEKFDEIFKAQ